MAPFAAFKYWLNNCFSTSRDSNPYLPRIQITPSLWHDQTKNAFAGQAAQNLTYDSGMKPTILFWDSNYRGTTKVRNNDRGTLPEDNTFYEFSESLQNRWGLHRGRARYCLFDVTGSKTWGTWSRPSRKGMHSFDSYWARNNSMRRDGRWGKWWLGVVRML